MTIASKLSYLNDTKTAIKEALINKGVEVSDTDTFRSYADKISEISGGQNQGISPQKTHGLCLWLDGQCNTRIGKDHSKDYLENIVYNNPNSAITSWGVLEYPDNGTNEWVGDFLKYNAWAHYPYIYNSSLTIEAVVRITERTTRVGIVQCGYTGGFVFDIPDNEQNFRFRAYNTGSSSYTALNVPFEYNQVYYLVGTIQDGKLMFKVNDTVVQDENFVSFKSPSQIVSTAVGTGATTASQKNIHNNYKLWYGLELGMIRVWGRVLSDEEIQANYQDAKSRFNF